MGVEPTSSAWKAEVIAVIRQARYGFSYQKHAGFVKGQN